MKNTFVSLLLCGMLANFCTSESQATPMLQDDGSWLIVLTKEDAVELEKKIDGEGKLIIPSGYDVIDDYAFYGCKTLKSVVIQDGVTYIGLGAFAECDRLQSVHIPNTVEDMHEYVFAGCISLQEVKLPENLSAIRAQTFERCYSLQTIDLPKTLKDIEEYAFESCIGLKSIAIPSANTRLHDRAFSYCRNLESVSIPEYYSFDDCGFSGVYNLKQVTVVYNYSIPSSFPDFKTLNMLRKIGIPMDKVNISASLGQ